MRLIWAYIFLCPKNLSDDTFLKVQSENPGKNNVELQKNAPQNKNTVRKTQGGKEM